MSQSGEAAEQVVNMAANVTVKGVEAVSNIAGRGALSLATFLVAALKDQKKTKGKVRIKAFHGKPTKVFIIRNSELKTFAEEAKKYGVLYAAVVNKKQPGGLCDIVVNANDAAKVNRIAERFALSTVEVEKMRKKADGEKARTTPPAEKEANTMDDETGKEMSRKPNPTRTEGENRSASSSKNRSDTGAESEVRSRRSVRKQIDEIKSERRDRSEQTKAPVRGRTRQTVHRPPAQRKRRTNNRRR